MTGKAGMKFELTMHKDRSGLQYCSEDVLVITRLIVSEKVPRVAFPNGNFEGSSHKFSAKTLTNEVIPFVETHTGKRLFKK